MGLRESKLHSVFKRTGYVSPMRLKITNYERQLLSAYNPGAMLIDNRLHLFPRLIFGYGWMVSSIGDFSIDPEEAISEVKGTSFDTKIIKYPTESWEIGNSGIGGCEDARVSEVDGRIIMAYTAVCRFGESAIMPLQAYAILNKDMELEAKTLNYFKIVSDKKCYLPISWKDSVFLDAGEGYVLTRPTFMTKDKVSSISWSAKIDFNTGEIPMETFKPILGPESFEVKTGWSTNAVKYGSSDFLVGFHGVGIDHIYRNGIAVVNKHGELQGVSDYLLAPSPSIEEFYGDVPHVLFGCGLVQYKEYTIWTAGLSDYAIGIYAAKTSDILDSVRWLK